MYYVGSYLYFWRGLYGSNGNLNAGAEFLDGALYGLLVCLEAAAQGLDLFQLALQISVTKQDIYRTDHVIKGQFLGYLRRLKFTIP